MIFVNLMFKTVTDAVLLALAIATAHFIINGQAIGNTGFLTILPICFIFAVVNLIIRFVEVHKMLTGKQ